MNWPIVIIVGTLAIVLIVFLVRRNQKDKKEFVRKLNNDYPKTGSSDGDVEMDEPTDRVQ